MTTFHKTVLALVVIGVVLLLSLASFGDQQFSGLLSPGRGGVLTNPNPFDQSLNTTDSPMFSGLTTSSHATISGDFAVSAAASPTIRKKASGGATGTCEAWTNTAGTTQYLRIVGSTLTINTTSCQ